MGTGGPEAAEGGGEPAQGGEKRDLLGTIVRRVVFHKDGADVVFHPGVFAAPGRQPDGDLTLYTTCIVCDVQRLRLTFSVGVLGEGI